ncbi:MAG: hypothetical protein ACE14T_08840 [Syntrophales bacterium]
MKCKIASIRAMEILDSRGNPTVKACAEGNPEAVEELRSKYLR